MLQNSQELSPPWRARPLRVQLQLYVSVTCSLQIVVQIVA
jgi:hypothetical protein